MDPGKLHRPLARYARSGDAPTPRAARQTFDAPVAKPAVAPARILVVEDQEDVRRMVATALEIEGYEVEEASNATEGLTALGKLRYHLVLSDYAMPGGTGTWMLEEAQRRGLMERTVAIIVTAHPDVRELADVAVINKPLDLDYFLEQVRKILAASGVRAPAPTVVPMPAPLPAERPPHKVEFVLYISSTSSASIQARQNLEQLLARFDPTYVKYSVIDLLEDPMAGDADRIAFTPTLVKREPGPRTWILGNLRNPQIVSDLLQASGIAMIR